MRLNVLVLSVAVVTSTQVLGGEPVLGSSAEAAREAPLATDGGVAQVPSQSIPTTVVTGERLWNESQPTGSYQQPGWTDRRRFPGTRVYVAPAGTATFEFWTDTKVPFSSDGARVRTLWEMSFGLGHRLQLDLYLRTESTGTNPMSLESERVELRWALANWGVIPGNPTLYLEWIHQTAGPMRGEVKLLLGGEFSSRLYWGANLFFESDLFGANTGHEYGLTGGLSYSLLDSKLSLGGEARVEVTDDRRSGRVPLGVETLAGPAVSWRPVPSANVLLVWFVGPEFSRGSAADPFAGTFVMQPTVIAGWRF